jgi:hypothetical protein
MATEGQMIADLSPRADGGGAERLVRCVLRVPRCAEGVDEAAVQRMFSLGMVLSATRCLITYVLLPLVVPFLGLAARLGPALGIVVGIPALFFDVVGVRRFWIANHRWKWLATFVYAAVMCMVAGLVLADAISLV